MKRSRQGAVAIRARRLAAAVRSALGGPAPAPRMRVLADIAARDLDTSQGPPLNAFFVLNPNAVAQAEALDRKRLPAKRPAPCSACRSR